MKTTLTIDEAFRVAVMFAGRRVDDLMPLDMTACTLKEIQMFRECVNDLNTDAEQRRPVSVSGIDEHEAIVFRNAWV